MRHTSSQLIGLAIGMILALGAAPASAQITAAGPYYAVPSWNQTLPGTVRFIVLANMNSDAVLDRETGLVWERSPSTYSENWSSSTDYCVDLLKGNRMGWRLPTIHELQSLVDYSVTGLKLPSGHPFQNVQMDDEYWSATSDVTYFDHAHIVAFRGTVIGLAPKTSRILAWCVRGGSGLDAQ